MHENFFHKIKVYYEDTDSGGVVYYANYLKFLERARSEAIYKIGLTNTKLLNEDEIRIIVKSCKIDYKKPAKFEDKLKILSSIKFITKTSFTMHQIIKKDKEIITEADIHLVVVNKHGKPCKIPEKLKKAFKEYIS